MDRGHHLSNSPDESFRGACIRGRSSVAGRSFLGLPNRSPGQKCTNFVLTKVRLMSVVQPCPYSGGSYTRVQRILGRVPVDLRFRCPLEAKSCVRGPKIDLPGAQGRVFDLTCPSCGRDRRCSFSRRGVPTVSRKPSGFDPCTPSPQAPLCSPPPASPPTSFGTKM